MPSLLLDIATESAFLLFEFNIHSLVKGVLPLAAKAIKMSCSDNLISLLIICGETISSSAPSMT